MSCAQGWVLSAATLVIAPGCSGDGAELQGSTGRGSITARATACAADALEPSSSAALPRHLSVGEALTGRACPNEPDVFLLDTSERAGELLQVHLTQLQGLGEHEPTLVASATDVAGTRTSSEVRFVSQGRAGAADRDIGFVARGERHVLTVSVFTDLAPELAPGRAYRVSLESSIRSDGDCCSSAEGLGCADDALLTCLCQLDNACCRGLYDATCVAEARAGCSLVCGGEQAKANCCTASGVQGCSEPSAEECVCAIDPYCCVGGFDEHCVNLAVGRCGVACPNLDPEGS